MTDLASPPAPPVAREKTMTLRPTFFGALRGMWLLTWKSQLTWRRLPMGMLILLALPALIYVTTTPLGGGSRRQSLLGNPAVHFKDFSRRLANPLQPEQHAKVLQIFAEEYARTESDLRAAQSSDASGGQASQQVQACYGRIRNRVQPVLDERQFAQYQTFEKRKLLEQQRQVSLPRWNRTGPFYHWLIDFYFFVILPLYCVKACGALIRDELQADTLGFLTTRPMSRARLLVVKYLSQTAWLQILLFVEVLLLFSAGGLRQVPALGALLPLVLATQFLAVLAWSALGTFLGQVTNRYMAMAMVYGLIVEMGIGRIPTNINNLSLMRHLKILLAHNSALQGIYDWPVQGVLLSVGALALAAGIFLSLAAIMFTVKEYHHTAEMQK